MTARVSERIPHETLHDLETAARCAVAVGIAFVGAAVAGVELLVILLRPRPPTRPFDR